MGCRINNRSIDVWFVMIGQYLEIWNLRVQKGWSEGALDSELVFQTGFGGAAAVP